MKRDLSFIGKNIRYFRRQRGWSIAMLARKAGLSEIPLGRIERGENAPSAAALYGLSGALNLSVDLFFSENDHERNLRQAEETGDPFVCTLGPEQKRILPQKIRTMSGELIKCFCALEDICNAHKHAKIPLFVPFTPNPSGMEALSAKIRQHMGIEHGVVFDYFELFENAGFRIIVAPMSKKIESFSYFDRINQNAFYFINERLNPERQLFKLCYELGRVLILTYSVQHGGEMFATDDRPSKHDPKPFTAHRAARRFAACFLMPEAAVQETVRQLGIENHQWSYDLLLRIKHRFGVSAETFLYRLDELGLIEPAAKDDLTKRIDDYYRKTDFCEPDSSRRMLTPNGRLWDLVLVGTQNSAYREEVKSIEHTLKEFKVQKL